MKYLCLEYHDTKTWDAMPEGDRQSLRYICIAFGHVLRTYGQWIDFDAVDPFCTATTMRFEQGHVSVAGGPLTDPEQRLGRFTLLEANDLNRAIQLMSRSHRFRLDGCVEIRPIIET